MRWEFNAWQDWKEWTQEYKQYNWRNFHFIVFQYEHAHEGSKYDYREWQFGLIGFNLIITLWRNPINESFPSSENSEKQEE